MTLGLIIGALAIHALSGVPGLLCNREKDAGRILADRLTMLGSVLGLVGVVYGFLDTPRVISVGWGLPEGRFTVGFDALSLLLLIPVFLLAATGSRYGRGYWRADDPAARSAATPLLWGLLSAAMGLVILARDGVLLMMAWETMALAGFFLIAAEPRRAPRSAAWGYLLASHAGTLCLLAMFAILRTATGSFTLTPLSAVAAPGLSAAVILLAVAGFGTKSGLMPLHAWLPSAYAAAPPQVAALFSGSMIGVYGLLRITTLFPDAPPWWGAVLMAMGAASGLIGILLALTQSDAARLLAYSSIENVGVVTLALGFALLGRSTAHPEWVVLGLGGAILHLLNHSLFKPVLFYTAGALHRATGTRQLDQLGGLAKAMPHTAALATVGAVAICALPPLNGFVGEMLIYLGLLNAVGADRIGAGAALAAPVLAIIGAVGVACFVKFVGVGFLGRPRSAAADHAHDPPPAMIRPAAVLAIACIVIGVAPRLLATPLDRAIAAWSLGEHSAATLPSLADLAPLDRLSAIAAVLLAGIAAGALLLRRAMRTRPLTVGPTWTCGYAHPTPRMQHTGSALAQPLAELTGGLGARVRTPRVRGLFPRPVRLRIVRVEPLLQYILRPAVERSRELLPWVRLLQAGRTQVYLLYVLLAVIALLLLG